MRKYISMMVGLTAILLLSPFFSIAQNSTAQDIRGLHQILDDLYNEVMPMCGDLESIGQAIAGFAATFYIGSRVWKHIANAEPIDFYPLFRPLY
jgi:hypothetical protein